MATTEEKGKEQQQPPGCAANGASGRPRSSRCLENLQFDNLALRRLPLDSEAENYPRPVSGACFSTVQPTPVEKPQLVCLSKGALQLLDLDVENEKGRSLFVEYFSGNKILPGARPAAHCYCGHQFGLFSGQLGDGATMYLGEIVNSRNERWEIQFKGAGKTPYSRRADGRKVLRSSLREFLCSEAMHNLGIPTTRAGTLVTSDTYVDRDIFYTGDVIQERASILLRIAPTFLRFGSFEIFKPVDRITGREGPSSGLEEKLLPDMVDYTMETFFAEIWNAFDTREERCTAWFRKIVHSTATLVARWQCVGWCHGVLNTDNMSIVGLTIDYGPFGFMERYDPDFICNNSDESGRYSYTAQPRICKWNCGKLAEVLVPILDPKASADILAEFDQVFDDEYMRIMRRKLGLSKALSEDKQLVDALLETMSRTGADFTHTFRRMADLQLPGTSLGVDSDSWVQKLLPSLASVEAMAKAVEPRIPFRDLQMLITIAQQQPMFLRHMGTSPEVIVKAMRDYERARDIRAMTEEDKRESDKSLWQQWLSRYMDRLDTEVPETESEKASFARNRAGMMNSTNPSFVLRNYVAEKAIRKANDGDYSEVEAVFRALENPYDEESGKRYPYEPPAWAKEGLRVS